MLDWSYSRYAFEDIPFFTELVYSTTRIFSFRFTAEGIPEIESSASQLMDYTERLASARRAAPRDDFLSTYRVAADQAGEMSPLEILIQLLFVIVAGMIRPVALSPSRRFSCSSTESSGKQCVAIPVLVPGAVAEALRFEPSVASVSRFALEDIELDGYVLNAGQFMTLSTMSAMRDEKVFEAPDTFDIFRTDRQRWHLVFGGGAHRCLGEALARTELEKGLAALTARIPRFN